MANFLKPGLVAQCRLIIFIANDAQSEFRTGADVTGHGAGCLFDCFGIKVALQFVGAAGRVHDIRLGIVSDDGPIGLGPHFQAVVVVEMAIFFIDAQPLGFERPIPDELFSQFVGCDWRLISELVGDGIVGEGRACLRLEDDGGDPASKQ